MDEHNPTSESKPIKLRFEETNEKNSLKVYEGYNGSERMVGTMYTISKEQIDFFERVTKQSESEGE